MVFLKENDWKGWEFYLAKIEWEKVLGKECYFKRW